MTSCACEPRQTRQAEAGAYLHRLDGPDAHDRLGEEPVQPAVPVDVAAQTDGNAASPAPR